MISNLELKTAQIRRSALEQKFISSCHDNNIRVFFFYADEPSDMKQAMELGVDGILTNYPNKLQEILTKEI